MAKKSGASSVKMDGVEKQHERETSAPLLSAVPPVPASRRSFDRSRDSSIPNKRKKLSAKDRSIAKINDDSEYVERCKRSLGEKQYAPSTIVAQEKAWDCFKKVVGPSVQRWTEISVGQRFFQI